MTDVEFDRLCDLFSAEQKKLGFTSIWSMYDDFVSFDEVVFDDGIIVEYDVDDYWGNGKINIAAQEGKVTKRDLWRLAEQVIVESGDEHHVYIELFKPLRPGVVELWCGS